MGNMIPVSTARENTFRKNDNKFVQDKTFQYTNTKEVQKTQYLKGVPYLANVTSFYPYNHIRKEN